MNQEKLAKIIKDIRLKDGLTQKEFAEKYNVSFQAVSKWETGKNIPDIALLKQICNDHNISLDEILGNSKVVDKKNKKYVIITLIILILIVIITTIILILNNRDDFSLKKLSSTCSTFELTGSVAYNKNKSSFYISNIEFCGNDDDIIYNKIEYSLYENYNNKKNEISSGNTKYNINLEQYLKDLSINVDNYNQSCKTLTHSEIIMEIYAYDDDNKITTYKIPLSLENNCD
jgi:transcriptional regulator with XRE-family HTH domain